MFSSRNPNLFETVTAVACCLLITVCMAGCQSGSDELAGKPRELGKGGMTARALTERDADKGRFTQLSASETGLDFTNVLQPEHMRKYLLNGAGVATGDYDNDGLVDVFAVSQDGTNKLFRQSSPWKFEDVTESAGGLGGEDKWGTGASFADINNDGWLDLYVCNINGPNQLFVNQRDGTFRDEAKQRGVDFAGATTMGSFADYDRDGDLDLYLVNNRVFSIEEEQPNLQVRKIGDETVVHPDFVEQYFFLEGRMQEAGQRDRLMQNDGSGKFVDVTESSGIAGYDMGLSATWWDYDNDGWVDLYVANDLKSPDHLYRNLGNGKFKDLIADTVGHTPWFSMGADSADINNDGLADLLVADMSSTTHYKQKTTMGEMGNSAWFLTIGRPRQFMRNALFVNSGSSRFYEAANLTGLDSTDWSWSIKFADFDSDTKVDVFVTNGVGRNMNDSDLANEYRKLMEAGKVDEANEQILKMPPLEEANLAFRNLGDLKFENVSKSWGLDFFGVSQGSTVADIDRDGDLDLIVSNMNQPLTVYRNDHNQGNNLLLRLVGTKSNQFGVNCKVTAVTGDSSQVRFLNLARGYMSADEPLVHFGLGDATTVDELIVRWPSGVVQSFSQVEANQFVTITEGEANQIEEPEIEPKPAWLKKVDLKTTGLDAHQNEISFDDYRFQPLLPNKLTQLGPALAWGDVNGDGFDDCFVGGSRGIPGKLFIQNDDGSFTNTNTASLGSSYEDMGAVFFDVDGDDDLDLYIASGGYELESDSEFLHDRLYLNDGTGQFAEAPEGSIPNLKNSSSSVSAVDFDRDGDLDVFVGTRLLPRQWPLPVSSVLLENQGGKLVDVTSEKAPNLIDIGLVTGAVWSDVDGDGWNDLLVSLEWGPIRLLHNQNGALVDATESAGLSKYVGWWNSITGGDIDNDGDMDFVAMNVGLNTKYHASEKHPAVLFVKDFDNNGTLDLVEAEWEGDICFPIRGESCSTHAMPFLNEKFDTYHEFALADVANIYTDEALEQADKFSASHLASVVLINDGKGKFNVKELPRLAQISPGFGVVLQDMDGDGNCDLCIAQNFMHPQPETGQMDGGMGQIFKGLGNGEFVPLPPTESGIVVEGQGMALTVVDLNRDAAPDLVMSVNDQPVAAWTNEMVSSSKPMTARLSGAAGNRSAIGSRVVKVTQSGKRTAMDVCAGAGYLSQSSATIFFANDPHDPVTQLEVTWPDGTKSMLKVDATMTNIEMGQESTVSR